VSAAHLSTFAPRLAEPPNSIPTGNLAVSLPEIDRRTGSVDSLGVVLAAAAGVLTAHGGTDGLASPLLTVDGDRARLQPRWQRDGDWLPRFTAELPQGQLTGWYVAPVGERGVVLRLLYRHMGEPAEVELGWSGGWSSSSVEHLRGKPVAGVLEARDDGWTGSRVVGLSAGLPLLALAWRAGEGAELTDDGSGTGWRAIRPSVLGDGEELACEVFLGVAPEPDGAAATALHLRRRGFASLLADTLGWLAEHRLPVDGPLGARLAENLFFCWFYAQADCLDDGRPVLLTSRSPHYYVCAAFWSRDAYCWTLPALLLVDPDRARAVLVETLRAGSERLPDHALYLNGTSLYPGFELDQAAAPILAVARYVAAADDWSVLTEPGVGSTLQALVRRVEQWRHPEWALYGTFLLPTDDPTDHPYATTGNALLAAAFDALATLVDGAAPGALLDADWTGGALRTRAAAVRRALTDHLVVDGPYGPMWAWACDADGRTELRDEPPLGLLTLPFWAVGGWDDPVHEATRRWLREEDPHWYDGPFGGAGAAHFPYPSGFDLANRLLAPGHADRDPLRQLVETPMDQGLACESWDPQSGQVTTGAAMASMAGLLAWTAWARLQDVPRWDVPLRNRSEPGEQT